MNRINSAVSLLTSIGGAAAWMAAAAQEGLVKPRPDNRPANNPAGSKLSRQITRGTKGLTCRSGFPINRKVA